jgi:hypothetical protein
VAINMTNKITEIRAVKEKALTREQVFVCGY